MSIPKNPSMKSRYPSRSRRETVIHDLRPGRAVWAAGRLHGMKDGGFRLADATGSVRLDLGGGAELEGLPSGAAPSSGDLVEVEGTLTPGGSFAVTRLAMLCPGRPAPPAGSPNESLWCMPRDLFDRRRELKDALRRFFLEQGFVEVESPRLVRAPGQEPHLDPFRSRLDDGRGGRERFLITSPEYFHKRLLVAGFEKIFEAARVFRNGPSETAGLHHYEFLMVEWYRAFASYLEIMEDVENLVHRLAREAGLPDPKRLEPPYERLPMQEAFQRLAGVDLEPFLRRDPSFALSEAAHGDHGILPGDSLSNRFYKIFLSAVEPALGRPRPVFLIDFPTVQASLSKVREDRPEVCERFELYIDGIELANGFTELNDPEEQLRRFEAEARERSERGAAPVPMDEVFLEALRIGMPPSGGVALGFDRLCMVLLEKEDLRSVLPFMEEEKAES